MNVTPETLAELRRLHLNATAAPWVVEEPMEGILIVGTSDEEIWKRLDILQISVRGKARLRGEFNGRFIALVRNNIGALLDELEAVKAERDKATDFIVRKGYRRCDIMACNCDSWHGGHASARLDEIREELDESDISTNGKTILGAVQELLAERDGLRAALTDMHAGWRYIRQQHGDLPGVGWDRCEKAATAALGAAP